jgi:hypothetical protein
MITASASAGQITDIGLQPYSKALEYLVLLHSVELPPTVNGFAHCSVFLPAPSTISQRLLVASPGGTTAGAHHGKTGNADRGLRGLPSLFR